VGKVLGHALPLALGAAVNTRVLASEAALLTRPPRPLRSAIVFGAGAAVPLLVIGTIALVSVHITVSAISDEQALLASAIADIVVGALLLLVATWLLWSTPAAADRDPSADALASARRGWPRTFLRGAGVMTTDLSTLAMFAAAAKDIALGRIGLDLEAAVFLLVLGITLVTAWLPPLLFGTSQGFAQRLLPPIGRAVDRHGRRIGEILLTAVGAYLVIRGSVALI
jgi:hypothetical protein